MLFSKYANGVRRDTVNIDGNTQRHTDLSDISNMIH